MTSSNKKVTLKQRAKRAGIPVQLVYNRMHDGWSERKALSVPVRKKVKHKKVNKVEPEKVTPEKVTPKKAPSPLKQRVSNPLPIQKYEAKRNNKIWYIIAFVGLVIIVTVVNT